MKNLVHYTCFFVSLFVFSHFLKKGWQKSVPDPQGPHFSRRRKGSGKGPPALEAAYPSNYSWFHKTSPQIEQNHVSPPCLVLGTDWAWGLSAVVVTPARLGLPPAPCVARLMLHGAPENGGSCGAFGGFVRCHHSRGV